MTHDLFMPIRLDGKVVMEVLLPVWHDSRSTFCTTKNKESDGLPRIFLAHPLHLPLELNKKTRRFETVHITKMPVEVLKTLPEIKRESIKI